MRYVVVMIDCQGTVIMLAIVLSRYIALRIKDKESSLVSRPGKYG